MGGGNIVMMGELGKKEVFIEILKIVLLGIFGIVLFLFYMNFITYREELKGEKVFFVKFDGKMGSIKKVENKYLKENYFIKNSKNLDYGYYKIRVKINKIVKRGNNNIIEGKIIGYKGQFLNKFRKYISNIFDDLFIVNKNLHFFAKGGILGEKGDSNRELTEKFKYTGLAHLIVISGTHIGLVIMGIVKIFEILNLQYKVKYLLALVVLSVYCATVGFTPGVTRAYIMGAMMILARLLFEEEDVKKSLHISLIIILVLNPYSIFDISMQMSYMAVIAIVYVYPPIEKYIKIKYLKEMEGEILKGILLLLLLSFTIQITSIPIFLYYFEKLPLFSFLLNVVGIPLGTLLVQLLFIITFINILGIKIFNILLVPIVEIVYGAFEGFVLLGSKIPLLQITVPKISIIFVIMYYSILIFIVNIFNKSVKNMV